MTLEEFSATCQSRADLCPLWQELVTEAHKLISKSVRVKFLGEKKNSSEEKFILAKQGLERACSLAGLEYPDLGFKAFKNWILRY